MDRIKRIIHKGKPVTIFDFSNMKPGDEALDLVQKSIDVCKKSPLESILSITDVTDSHFDKDIVEAMKRFSEETKAHTKKSAVVGIEGMKRVGYDIVMSFSKRKLPIFKTCDDALDWLVEENMD